MVLVGKPGSGKSYLAKELAMSAKYYKGKFNGILVVSPSAQKLGISDGKASHTTVVYDMDWFAQ